MCCTILKNEKEVSRTRRNSNSDRYQEELVFNLKYNPTTKDTLLRVFAKVIDLFIYILVTILIYILINRMAFDDLEIYSASLMLLLLINLILETKYGKSLGKKFLKIQVIDDFCEYPNLLKSYKRNFFSLVNVFNLLRILPAKIGAIKNNKHNEICVTYTIRDKRKPEILELLKEEQS